ncbi:MAG: lysoplasmalogenase family protein [Defluviitaleaceae bacterium]|nr:lysoplasmalogenase family protein [Defluviitaleaceae bacterium]
MTLIDLLPPRQSFALQDFATPLGKGVSPNQTFIGGVLSANVKFAFISFCLLVAVVSFFWRRSGNNWLWLVGGLAATLLSDYFLVLKHNNFFGVATFCFAHVCYIFRAEHSLASQEQKRRYLLFCVLGVFACIWVVGFFAGNIIILAGLYASLFALNIFVNFFTKTRHPKHYQRLVMTGLILFALCDVSVMLYNLPKYAGAPAWLLGVYPLIWVFYLPSQALLAISGFSVFNAPTKA